MADATYRLLLVEDNPADIALTEAVLEDADVPFALTAASSLREACAAMEDGGFDAVLLDLFLPDSTGLDTVTTMRQRFPALPIVVVSGANSPTLRRGALEAGASEFVWKNEPERGVVFRVVRHAIERSRAEQGQRDTRLLLDAIPDAVLVVDAGGVVRDVNAAATRMFAIARVDLIGQSLGFSAGPTGGTEIEILGGGRTRIGEMRVAEIEWQGELATLALIRDVTEMRNLEERLRDAQKMEAVGLLAGGLAHDFNNLLVVIMGNVEFLMLQLDEGDPRRTMVEKIEHASERARQLTSQLLVFARRKPSKPAVVEANAAVMQVYGLLRRSVPSSIVLETRPTAEAWRIRVDPSEFDQMLLNLAFNARHAMPSGGNLDIDLDNIVVAREIGRLTPGAYVRIDVRDSGTGIPADHLDRIFEPFFTTKASGTGTGLGLAICREIARKAGGDILVASVEGEGSTFSVHLPRCEDPLAAATARVRAAPPVQAASGSILVVDDDASVATAVRDALAAQGFGVVVVRDGEAAREIIAADHSFDLVVCDAVMPRLSGPKFAAWLAESRPAMKLLMMTGYSDDVASIADAAGPRRGLILKPFTPTQLVAAVRGIVGGAAPAA